jgi:putative hemolysin
MSQTLIVVLLVAFNALLTLGELAVLTSRKSRLREAAEQSQGARAAHELASHPESFLSAIQLWITLCAILLGYFGEDSLGAAVEVKVRTIPALEPYAHVLGLVLGVGGNRAPRWAGGQSDPRAAARRPARCCARWSGS